MYLIFDTETTGLPKNYNLPHTATDNWPRLVQIAWQIHNKLGKLIEQKNYIVKPDGFTIPFNSEKIHGISTERAKREGHNLKFVLEEFAAAIEKSQLVIGHNVEFDLNVTGAEFVRTGVQNKLFETKHFCTKDNSIDFCAIPGGKGGRYKWPNLTELHIKLFGKGFEDAHDAAFDVRATARCFFGLITQKVADPLDKTPSESIAYEEPKLDEANFKFRKKKRVAKIPDKFKGSVENFIPFSHLHIHTQYSILQSPAEVKKLITKAKENNMKALAITDLGNMHVAFKAVSEAKSQDIQLILGAELFVTEDRHKKTYSKNAPDRRFQQVFLAKNQEAYHGLSELCSLGFIEGFYQDRFDGFPRVDRKLISKYSDGLIALSGGLNGELAKLILEEGEHKAEEAFKWWLDTFGEDFYVEINRHGLEEEEIVTEILLKFAEKYNVKPIAANDVYYVNETDADAHDTLLCVKDGEFKNTPIGRGRAYRFGFPNHEFFFKTQEEMNELFSDLAIALENTSEIIEKCSEIKLKRDILMPTFEIPEEFENEDDYLKFLTYKGAKKRYPKLTDEIKDRLELELSIIKNMGFPGYFLIVQDFINEAKNNGISVGPGRGSAAGSAVAFCTGITNIDPIKYNLLFERFLNPERVSMPDIDIDFDDQRRQEVFNYVVEKYGKSQVAHIITFGTMAAKSAIRDVSRVMELPLAQANYLAKLVPTKPGITLEKAFAQVKELQEIQKSDAPEAEILQQAQILEGSVRNTGIHAAGIIIAPSDLKKHIPVCTAKDIDLLVTQFDGKYIESAGMLKMDFLGLKTLSIIKDAIFLVKKRRKTIIDPDEIPLDDLKTYELYQKGETIGTFQFESEGMRMYLKELKPTNIEDLIAMNALYRPGPMEFIPNFIKRKHGTEAVEYPHELLEPILKNTFGIMVYQEQIMQTAQIMAGYSLGSADILRRAMGKKKIDEMQRQKVIFVEGAQKLHNIPEKKAEEVFEIMEKFASYGFNRSHSAAYSIVAFQTAYLKANYSAEYMASVLTHNMNDIDKVTLFIQEASRMGISVLGPDVNESFEIFSVNKEGQIRFGMSAIKGAGSIAASAIIEERKNGIFKDIYDFVCRLPLKTVNKRVLEALAYSGALDSFKIPRGSFFISDDDATLLEKLISYGQKTQQSENSNQNSLFGDSDEVSLIAKPKVSGRNPWTKLQELAHEKETVGFYLSGHPLDKFRIELIHYTTCKISDLDDFKGRKVKIGGIITNVRVGLTKKGNKWARISIADFSGSTEISFFGEDFISFQNYLQADTMVFVEAIFEASYRNKSELEMRVVNVSLLDGVLEKYAKAMTINLNLDNLDPENIDSLEKTLLKFQGNLKLRFQINKIKESDENTHNLTLNYIATAFKIQPNIQLTKELDKMGLQYRFD